MLDALLGRLHLLVLLEVLNVLGVRQVLEARVLIVVLFPVVNLVLVLVVAVVPRSRAKVRQGAVLVVDEHLELVPVDDFVLVVIDQAQYLAHNLLLALLRHVLIGLIKQAVRPHDLLRLPQPVAVVVVEVEEGGCVEVGRVVFLCDKSHPNMCQRIHSFLLFLISFALAYQPCVWSSNSHGRRRLASAHGCRDRHARGMRRRAQALLLWWRAWLMVMRRLWEVSRYGRRAIERLSKRKSTQRKERKLLFLGDQQGGLELITIA